MNITSKFLLDSVVKRADVADLYAPVLQSICADYGIVTPLRLAAFLAQTGHESRNFEELRESLNYTPDALIRTFGLNRITKDQANQLGRTSEHSANQVGIANIVYGGPWGLKNLGNDRPGDGWRFRGTGLIQTTGRSNVRRVTKRLRARYGDQVPDFEQSPHLLVQPQWAVASAADYWDEHGLNELADDPNEFETLTGRINAGLVGLADRTARWRGAQASIAKFGVF